MIWNSKIIRTLQRFLGGLDGWIRRKAKAESNQPTYTPSIPQSSKRKQREEAND